MNDAATSFAASKRFGFKSCGSILPEISIANMISIPSVEELDQLFVDCGRAKITISSATATIRNTKGT